MIDYLYEDKENVILKSLNFILTLKTHRSVNKSKCYKFHEMNRAFLVLLMNYLVKQLLLIILV